MLRNRYNICKRDYESLVNKNIKGNRQVGGNIPLEIRDSMDTFTAVWKNVSNSGQHNCGIFLNPAQDDRIVKCVGGDMEQSNNLTQIINHQAGFHIFPEIYSYFTFSDNPVPSQHFIEMERFNGDVTDLIMRILPKMCISFMNLDPGVASDLYQLFEFKIPTTMADPRLGLRFHFTPIIIHIINNIDTVEIPKTQEQLAELGKRNGIKVEEWTTVKDIQRTVKKFQEFVAKFSASNLTKQTYDEFITLYKTTLNKYLPMINEQLFVLRYRLLETGYVYGDNKFDNFAFTLSEENTDYMNVRWGERNRIGDKYFFLHILDWESGLFKADLSDPYVKSNILRDYVQDEANHMSVHGQYNLRNLNAKIITSDTSDIFTAHGIPQGIIDIMTQEISYEVVPEKKPALASLEDVMEFIESKNPKSYDLKDEMTKKLGDRFNIEDAGATKIILIKGSEGHNNFTEIQYDKESGEYTITCLDDSRKPATDTRFWPKGQIVTRDIHQLIKIINAIY